LVGERVGALSATPAAFSDQHVLAKPLEHRIDALRVAQLRAVGCELR
jgi:hypothetical protein